MTKVNLYYIEYLNGHVVSHYDINQLIKMINDYNTIQFPKIKMTIHKITRYTSGNARIPPPFKYFKKTRLNEVIGVKNLARVNYDEHFQLVNQFSTRELQPQTNLFGL